MALCHTSTLLLRTGIRRVNFIHIIFIVRLVIGKFPNKINLFDMFNNWGMDNYYSVVGEFRSVCRTNNGTFFVLRLLIVFLIINSSYYIINHKHNAVQSNDSINYNKFILFIIVEIKQVNSILLYIFLIPKLNALYINKIQMFK